MKMKKEVLIEVKPLDNISYTDDKTLFKHRVKEVIFTLLIYSKNIFIYNNWSGCWCIYSWIYSC